MSSSVRFDFTHEATATCRACQEQGLDHFYQVDNVPTTSNLLMRTREEAIAWSTGELRLARCPKCGFITNTAFDPATQQLTAQYEATQACSPTFGKFARELAEEWTNTYRLRGKKILEIGCGHGEFISMMCEIAGATGWGFDPIVDPVRASNSRVQFIPEKFGSKWLHLKPDFFVCRHTLEHIRDVHEFLVELEKGASTCHTIAIVAIEVPDTSRVLEQAAFWDIYYEHCSYFDRASLAIAMRQADLEAIRTRLEYGGQYLIMEAAQCAAVVLSAELSHDWWGEVKPSEIVLTPFSQACAQSVTRWRTVLATPCRTVIWGSGSKAVGFLTTLGVREEVIAVVDINPAKHGTFLPGTGHEIIAPEKLREIRPDRVIAMNPVYLEEIGRSIAELGLSSELIALD